MEQRFAPAYEGKKPYLFVSYAHLDSAKVLPVVNELFDKKYRVWYDEGIAPGSEWPKNIADHLNAAEAVIVFVSKHSLASPNCENEVVRAVENSKQIFCYSLDGNSHPKLKNENSAATDGTDALLKSIPDKYIGDGTGYERNISKHRFGAIWNALIAAAAVLALAIGVGLFGLNKGWFDAYLPGLDTSADVVEESRRIKEDQKENINLNNSFIAGAIAAQTDKSELGELISLTDERSADAFYGWLQWNKEDEHRYIELTLWSGDFIELSYCDQELLNLMPYFPNLRELRLGDGEISDLTVLTECPRLEQVHIPCELFPVTIPENARFDVILNVLDN